MKALIKAVKTAKENIENKSDIEVLSDLIAEVEKFIENPPNSVAHWAEELGVNHNTMKTRAKNPARGYKIGQIRVLDWLEAEELANNEQK